MKIKISEQLNQLSTIDYTTLIPWQGNLKDLSVTNYNKLKKSLTEFGFFVPLFVWFKDGNPYLMDGTQRHRVLMKECAEPKDLPFIAIEAETEQDAKKKLLVISSQYGRTTQEGMDEFAFDIDDEWLKDTTNFDALFDFGSDDKQTKDGLTDPDACPEPAKTTETKLGDIFKLGDHMIICGDSTDPVFVDALLGGVKPHLLISDPPYGVEYDADWRNEHDSVGAWGKKSGKKIATGTVKNDQNADWTETWKLSPCSVAYVWHAGIHAGVVADSLAKADFEIRSQIIWAKPRFAISRGHYHWQHEPCWYAVRKKATGSWVGDRSQTTLWEISHNKSETGHSTQKPVEAMLRPMLNNSSEGQAVYDPFLGSGTTLIAAEQSGRVCYGIEIDPIYIDMIVRRFEDFTGKKAEKIRNIYG